MGIRTFLKKKGIYVYRVGHDDYFSYWTRPKKSEKKFLPDILGKIDFDMIERIHAHKISYYSVYIDRGVLNTFLTDMIQDMKLEYYVALVTTASSRNTKELLEHFNLMGLFDKIYTAEDVGKPKPDPEGYLKAISDFHMVPEDVVIFEDADVRVEAATKIGARCYKVC